MVDFGMDQSTHMWILTMDRVYIFPQSMYNRRPSGYVKIDIEYGPFIVDFPTKMLIFNSYVAYQRVSEPF